MEELERRLGREWDNLNVDWAIVDNITTLRASRVAGSISQV